MKFIAIRTGLFIKKDESDPIILKFTVHFFVKSWVPKWKFLFITSKVKIEKVKVQGLEVKNGNKILVKRIKVEIYLGLTKQEMHLEVNLKII